MTKKKTTSSRRLPKYVRAHHDGYRSVFQDGGQTIRSPTFDTVAKAEEYVTEFRGDRIPTNGPLTIQQGFDHLIASLIANGNRAGTIEYYQSHYKRVVGTGGWGRDTMLHRLTKDQVTRYVKRRVEAGISLGVVWNKEVQVLERIISQAIVDEHIAESPLKNIRRPPKLKQKQKRFPCLPAETIENLIRATRGFQSPTTLPSRERFADMLEFIWLTAMRRSETARLTREHIDMQLRIIRITEDVGKCGPRNLPITDRIRSILERRILIAGTGTLFPTASTIERLFWVWKKRIGEPKLCPHVLRASRATFLARKGWPVLQLMEFLGHDSPEQTRRYFHESAHGLRALMDRADSGDVTESEHLAS